jgi:hypothetical protein
MVKYGVQSSKLSTLVLRLPQDPGTAAPVTLQPYRTCQKSTWEAGFVGGSTRVITYQGGPTPLFRTEVAVPLAGKSHCSPITSHGS